MLESQRAAYADSTQRAHKLQWKTYIKFCLYFNRDSLPASAETVCLYAQFLSRTLKSPRSIGNYIAAVKILHILLEKSTDGFASFEVKLTLRGISRVKKHLVRQATPVTPQLLSEILQCLDINNPTDATFWSLFLIAFFAKAREFNLVPANKVSCRGLVRIPY